MCLKRDRQQLWEARYQRSCRMLKAMLEAKAPKIMLQDEARLLLTAAHGGPWRTIWALVRRELKSVWLHHGWFKWEWIRTRVFRRPQDATLAEAQRVSDEMDAVEEMAKKL
jgi:hypothetical protein